MRKLSRREIIEILMASSAGCVFGQDTLSKSGQGIDLDSLQFKKEKIFPIVQARHWDSQPAKKIQCKLCPQKCSVANSERGTCGVRENREGTYYTLVYSRVCAAHIDPIEKKPLFHYLPGTKALSIATPGCNIECQYCQNWQISQFRPEEIQCFYLQPENVIYVAKKYSTPTIAYTYSEPVIFYEYMYDTAERGKSNGIGSVMISNGYIQKDPLKKLITQLSAVKIDFKGFSEEFYAKVCRAHLKPVLDTLVTIAESGIWFELVMLVVPTLNDGLHENQKMFQWIKKNLGVNVPVHLTRFQPMYKLKNLPPTPVKTLETLRKEALDTGLNYVYIGNVFGHPAESTYCPSCHRCIIRRIGYNIVEYNVKNHRCSFCGNYIPGVFK